jgi:signal recognition particle subunit SRP54
LVGVAVLPPANDATRKRRIASGSGVHVSEINRLLKSHMQMQTMMKSLSKGGGIGRLMRAFGGGGGGFPRP